MESISILVTNVAQHAEEIPGAFQGLWPSLIVTVGALITLGILTFFITRYAYFPAKKHLETRKKHIENNINSATKLNLDAQKIIAGAEKTLEDANIKKSNILNESKKEVLEQREQIILEAKQDAEKIIKETKLKMEIETKQLKEKLEQEFIDISMMATEKLLKKNISKKENQKLIEEFIKDFGNEK